MFTLVHEGTHQQQTTTGLAEEILLGEGVGYGVFIETIAFVTDQDGKAIGHGFNFEIDFFPRVVLVTVGDGVDHTFADGHGNGVLIVFVEADFTGEFDRSLVGEVYAVESGVERLFHRFLLK